MNDAKQGAAGGQPDFTADDIAEARRLNRKLAILPRLRMETAFGRIVLNMVLRMAETYPLLRGRRSTAERELKSIEILDRRVKLRIFRPTGECRGIILDFHGGGWTIGNARMNDGQNAELAERLGVAVVSVDYRLALAAPVSAVIDDCEAAAEWVSAHAEQAFGARGIVIVGSSAGAHLAAATVIRLRDRGLVSNFRAIVLSFGLYDFSGTPMVRDARADNLILHGPTVRATLCKLTPHMSDDNRREPAISPQYADLSGLPPALFVVGTRDMLLDDSKRMAAKWQEANANAEILIAPESPHAFDRFTTAIAKKVQAYTDGWILRLLV